MFEEKQKEPILSEEMQDILKRSMDEKTSDNTDDIFRYKYKIMSMLTSNQDVLHALHNNDLATSDEQLNGDLYRNVCIFDYMKLPEDKSIVRNYICFEIDDSGMYNSKTTKYVTFRTVSHKDDCETDWGISRQDLLASIVKNEFDWSNALGMHLEKSSDKGYIMDGYYYREIVYTSTVPNNIYGKINRYG